MYRGENEHQQENEGLSDHDNATRYAIKVVTCPRTQKAGDTAYGHRNTDQAGKRSVSSQAVAPGVTTRQITMNAPTVCNAATVERLTEGKIIS